jgi:Zn-dependent protease with chaperone function
MFEEETKVVEQIVEKLANAAKLKTAPEIKISKAQRPLARAHFLHSKITISEAVLRRLKDGKMNIDDIESLLAHEVGHLVDFQKGLRSVGFKSAAGVVVLTLTVVGLALVLCASVISTGIMGALSLLVFLILLCLFPYVFRNWALRAQLEADRNASSLIEKERFAIAIVRQFNAPTLYGIVETWTLLLDSISWPRIEERLRNISLKPKDIQIRFGKRSSET